jgi:hypothetical protein
LHKRDELQGEFDQSLKSSFLKMINKVFVFALLAVSLVQVYCATVPLKAPKANAG